jgi:hypothetical protein
MDTLFLVCALIGGSILAFQFLVSLLGFGGDDGGMGHVHGMDLSGGDVHDFSGLHGDVTGDMHGHDFSGHDATGAAAHADHGGLNWFYEMISIRTLSAGLTFFGLTGKTMLAFNHPPWAAFGWAILAGLAALYIVYWLFKQVYRLQHAGNEDVRKAVGLPATVYVPISGKRGGTGKVTFRLQNRLVEYQAVTDDEERLGTGEEVMIVGIISADTVRVARVAKPIPA